MKNIKIIIFKCLLFLSASCIAQFPFNDDTWELIKEDQFNIYNSTDWYDMYPWGHYNNGAEYNDAANLNYSNGWLKIKSDNINPPVFNSENNKWYYYQGGCLHSKFKVKYGYFEANIKTPIGLGYWPAYWLWGALHCTYYNEIDIHERGGDFSVFSDRTTQSHHWWVQCVNDINETNYKRNDYFGLNNCANAHTYSVMWQPDRMLYFIDNATVHTMKDNVNTPSNSMHVIFNFAIDPWNSPNQNTPFPAYYEVDYLKIYQLKTACTTSEAICTFTKSNYNFKVKKDITFGGTNCNTTLNTSDGVTFWAKDYIVLDKNSVVNSNSSGYICFNTYNCSN